MSERPRYCVFCGEELPEAGLFCPHCGSRQPQLPAAGMRPGAAEPPTPAPEDEDAAEPKRRRPSRLRRAGRALGRRLRAISPKRVIQGIALLAALAGIGWLVVANWEPRPVLGELTAPRYERDLAAGGLSIAQLGDGPLIEALEAREPVGWELVLDAYEQNLIDDFRQVRDPKADVAFAAPPFRFLFSDNVFRLKYPPSRQQDADEIFALARGYGFFSDEENALLDQIFADFDSLLTDFADRQLTEGVSEDDLVARADALEALIEGWIADYGEHPATAQLLDAMAEAVKALRDVAADPTNPGLRRYDRKLDEYEAARRAYNAEVGE